MLKPRFHVAYRLPWLLCAWEVLGTLPIVYTFIVFTFYFFILYYLLFILLSFYLSLFIILFGTQNDWAVVRVCQQ